MHAQIDPKPKNQKPNQPKKNHIKPKNIFMMFGKMCKFYINNNLISLDVNNSYRQYHFLNVRVEFLKDIILGKKY